MKRLYLFIYLLAQITANAQVNLVPNPSFEEYINCPMGVFSIDSSIVNSKTVKSWFSPSIGTPDYFNICNSTYYSVPNNNFGFQNGNNGVSYAGFGVLSGKIKKLNNTDASSREYISCKLNQTLNANLLYEAFFYVSPADYGFNSPSPTSYWGFISSIGLYISPNKPYYHNNTFINVIPQIQNPVNIFLNDTHSWIKIGGIYKATGGEQYLTVGNFLNNITTPVQLINNNTVDSEKIVGSYYYIDDVSVTEYTPQSSVVDTVLCFGGSINMHPRNYADSSLWSDGTLLTNRTFTTPGKWWLTCYVNGLPVAADTLILHIQPPITHRTDTAFCNGQTLVLQALPATNYVWSNSANSQQIPITNTGTYWVQQTINSCVVIDTFVVSQTPFPAALPTLADTAFCFADSINIGHTSTGYTYTWLPQMQTTPNILVTQVGTYVLKIDSGFCVAYDTIIVSQFATPHIKLNPDTVVCFLDIKQVELDAGNFKTYLWQPTGQTTRTIYATDAMVYLLTVTDTNNCKASQNIAIDEQCQTKLFFANVFTPNGDDINDVYEVKGGKKFVQQFSLNIYNRWGLLVYSSSNVNQNWDGQFNNTPLPSDVYVLLAVYTINGKQTTVKQNVTLVR